MLKATLLWHWGNEASRASSRRYWLYMSLWNTCWQHSLLHRCIWQAPYRISVAQCVIGLWFRRAQIIVHFPWNEEHIDLSGDICPKMKSWNAMLRSYCCSTINLHINIPVLWRLGVSVLWSIQPEGNLNPAINVHTCGSLQWISGARMCAMSFHLHLLSWFLIPIPHSSWNWGSIIYCYRIDKELSI